MANISIKNSIKLNKKIYKLLKKSRGGGGRETFSTESMNKEWTYMIRAIFHTIRSKYPQSSRAIVH